MFVHCKDGLRDPARAFFIISFLLLSLLSLPYPLTKTPNQPKAHSPSSPSIRLKRVTLPHSPHHPSPILSHPLHHNQTNPETKKKKPDVTPKALTHRIAKLRSMAEDASTATSGASSGLSLPQPNKRTATKPRAPRSMTPGPAAGGGAAARKKAAVIEDNNDDDEENENEKKPVSAGNGGAGAGGINKRSATGAVKGANGKGMAKKSPLQNVVAADEDEDEEEGEEEDDIKNEIANKKVKTAGAGMVVVDAEAKNDVKEYA